MFIITDISAYTQFMPSHKKALVHGQMIISEFLNLVVQSKEPPLGIAKLEGDTVFLFAVKEDSVEFIESLKTKLGDCVEPCGIPGAIRDASRIARII